MTNGQLAPKKCLMSHFSTNNLVYSAYLIISIFTSVFHTHGQLAHLLQAHNATYFKHYRYWKYQSLFNIIIISSHKVSLRYISMHSISYIPVVFCKHYTTPCSYVRMESTVSSFQKETRHLYCQIYILSANTLSNVSTFTRSIICIRI